MFTMLAFVLAPVHEGLELLEVGLAFQWISRNRGGVSSAAPFSDQAN
jgi:hypothetical protein